MNRILFYVMIGLLIAGCETEDPDFGQIADDELIYEGVELQPSTWEKLEMDSVTYLSFGDISFYNENVGILAGFAGFVHITKDGGQTWRTIDTHRNMTIHCAYTLNEKTYIVARLGIFKSTDEGFTWTACNFPEEISVYNIWFRDSLNGFLSCSSGTYKTNNAGNNWRKVTGAIAKNLQFTSKDIGYFSYGSTDIYKSDSPVPLNSHGNIYRTTNGGNSWEKLKIEVKEITGMSFISDKTGFVSTIDGQLYKTSDGGETCIPVNKKDVFIKELFFVNENQGFVCTPDGIYITLDGGYTLIEEYTVDFYHSTYNFEFHSPTVGYAIGHGGLIIKRN